MHLDWSTLALQTVNVLVLLWLLRRFLFRPVQAIIAARQASAEAVLAEAAATRARAEAEAADLARQKQGLAAEGERIQTEARHAAEAERATILAQAQHEATASREAALAGMAREREAMRRDLEEEARRLAVAIATRLLGRFSADAANSALLESLLGRLAALSEDERQALTDPPAELQVVTAAPLDAAARGAWAERLGRALQGVGDLRFAADPSLIAGVELRGAHARVRNSWQADLERVAQELGRDDERRAVA